MPNYGCLITAVGRAKIANAIVTGVPLVLTEMSVGDGAGNAVTPSALQTSLVREVYRRSINAMTVSPGDADALQIEMVIPVDVGPIVIREAGVWDADGDLFATTALPTTVKPAPAEGATKDVVIIITAKVDNAAAVTVQVNPNIVIATRTWVDGNYLRLPSENGTTGQLLRKKSNAHNDFEYFNPDFDATGFVFDSVEEPQALAEGQTVVAFADITTAGIAVYVENQVGGLERLVRDVDYAILDVTTIELVKDDYPAGTRILGVQNDPNGAVTAHGVGALERQQNLADVPSKATARENLQLSYADEATALAGASLLTVMPPLRVLQLIDKTIPPIRRGHDTAQLGFFYRRSVPAGWLALRGGTFGPAGSAATVRANDDCWPLYEIWWNDFSQALLPVTGGRGASAAADWAAKKPMAIFNDVDEFYRAWNPDDLDHDLGTHEDDALQDHRHHQFSNTSANQLGIPDGQSPSLNSGLPDSTSGRRYNIASRPGEDATKGQTSKAITSAAGNPVRVANETRPKNRAVLVCVHL